MPPLFASRHKPGWLTVYTSGAGVDLVLVEPGAERPRVRVLASEALQGDLATTLADLRKRLGLKAYRTVVLLGAGSFQLLQTDAPAVPRAEWKEALRWKLKDLLDFAAEEAVFDVLDIPTEEFAPARQRAAFVVAAQRTQVAARIAPFTQANFPLAAVDIPETAQRNVAALFEPENRGLACIAFDETAALLTVTFHGELYAARRIEVSPAQIAAADEDRRAQLFERVALEAQRTLDAFDRQYSFMTVAKLLIAPRPELLGFADVLAANLYIPLETMDMSQVFDFEAGAPLMQPAEQSRLLYAIGAAMRLESAA